MTSYAVRYCNRSLHHRTAVLVIAVGVVAGLVSIASPAAAAPVWSFAPDNTSMNAALEAVSCPSVTSCFAVGYTSGSGSNGGTVVRHWNGSVWSDTVSPHVTGYLRDVTCPSASLCLAVGGRQYPSTETTVAERWNGQSWTLDPSQNVGTRGSELTSVSCPTSSLCFAVGHYMTNQSGATIQSLIERWNAIGHTWSVVSHPGSSGTRQLNSVSCPSATSCFAVGSNQPSGAAPILHWNGTAWSVMSGPVPPGTSVRASLSSVACVTVSNCSAVGFYNAQGGYYKTLVEHWNGSTWSIVPSPNAPVSSPSSSVLFAASCPSATSCFAVGFYQFGPSGSNVKALTEHWNGSAWSIMSQPRPPGYNLLQGVSCASIAACQAVGLSQPAPGQPVKDLFERYG
jgi:hypothetical protein